jgi:hypothetical protein
MLKRPSDGFWSGLVLGILVVTLLMYLDVDVNGPQKASNVSAIVTSDKAAASFVDAWQRMAQGTWSTTSTFTRTLASGATYTATLKNVQQPPNYTSQSIGSVTATIDGRNYACASVNSGQISGCRDTGAALPFATTVAQQVDAVRQLVSGSGQRMTAAISSYLRRARLRQVGETKRDSVLILQQARRS